MQHEQHMLEDRDLGLGAKVLQEPITVALVLLRILAIVARHTAIFCRLIQHVVHFFNHCRCHQRLAAAAPIHR
eukprot:2039428-Rhodomonas_salina.3